MIQKKRISNSMVTLASQKLLEIENLNRSYKKVLNYQRWTINEETVKDIIVNDDFLYQISKIYIGNVKSATKELLARLRQFGLFEYNFIASKECMFVNFDNPNAAYLCLKEVQGLKIGRTPSYPTEVPESYKNPDPTIVYLSNLHKDLSEEVLIDIFPDVEYIKMSYNGKFEHNGYCYIKFKSLEIVQTVLSFYSEFLYQRQRIYMCPLVVKMELPNFETPKLPAKVFEMKKKIDSRIFKKGTVLQLTNMIDASDFDDDFVQEMKMELSKHGAIEDLKFDVDKVVIINCKFKTQSQCRQAFEYLDGRFFGGRRINATIISL